jgi:hypothetical protein
MKTFLFSTYLLLSTLAFYGSEVPEITTFSNYCTGKYAENYAGAYSTINPNKSSYWLSYTLFNELSHAMKPYSLQSKVAFPSLKYKFETEVDSLLGRIFKVTNVFDTKGNLFKTGFFEENAILELQDIKTGLVLYQVLNLKRCSSNEFLYSGVKLDRQKICEHVIRKVDDFTDEIKIQHTIYLNGIRPTLILYKTISPNKEASYFLSLNAVGATAVVDATELIILFEDKTKIPLDVKISVDVTKEGYSYSCMIPLDESLLEIFAIKNVYKYRISIFDTELDKFEAEKFRVLLSCIKDAQ